MWKYNYLLVAVDGAHRRQEPLNDCLPVFSDLLLDAGNVFGCLLSALFCVLADASRKLPINIMFLYLLF